MLKNEPKLTSSQSVGFLLGLYYVASFVRHSPESSPTLPGSVDQHLKGCLAIWFATTIAAAVLPLDAAVAFVGAGGVIMNLFLFGSPLSVLKSVLRTKSAASIPLPYTLATIATCGLWLIYGAIAMKDAAVYLPTALGLVFGLAQLALKAAYGSGPAKAAAAAATKLVESEMMTEPLMQQQRPPSPAEHVHGS